MAFVCLLTAQALSAQDDSYIGVYVHAQQVVTIGDGEVGFLPRSTLRFEISLANEEGNAEIYLPDGMTGSLELTLERNGTRISNEKLNIVWSDNEERFALDGGHLPEGGATGLFEPRVVLKRSLTVSLRRGAFQSGSYTASLSARHDATLLANGATWHGRGGVGGARFALRDAISAEDQLRVRKLSAMDAMNAGEFVQAASRWQAIVDLDASDLDGWAGLGVANFHLNRHREAAECLERVMPAEPGDMPRSTLPLLLAESYVHLGELEEAERVLRLIALEPQAAVMLDAIEARVIGNE